MIEQKIARQRRGYVLSAIEELCKEKLLIEDIKKGVKVYWLDPNKIDSILDFINKNDPKTYEKHIQPNLKKIYDSV